MKGVFDTKPGSGYDDDLATRYHFPAHRKYWSVAKAVEGDWVLYREPKRDGGRRAYVGAAYVVSVEPDPADASHAYAYVTNFVKFDPPVSFVGGPQRYWESGLRNIEDRSLVGPALRGESLRTISDGDFAAVVYAGLGETLSPENLARYAEQGDVGISTTDTASADFVRRIEQILVNRKVREANFRRLICTAYEDTCAVTGLRIINGGGRSEVQAAHIWSVEKGGPDVVPNGLALSGTVHWLFDRHLISLSPDYCLLVAGNRIPPELRGLFPDPTRPIRLPRQRADWPSQAFMERHRDVFAGKG